MEATAITGLGNEQSHQQDICRMLALRKVMGHAIVMNQRLVRMACCGRRKCRERGIDLGLRIYLSAARKNGAELKRLALDSGVLVRSSYLELKIRTFLRDSDLFLSPDFDWEIHLAEMMKRSEQFRAASLKRLERRLMDDDFRNVFAADVPFLAIREKVGMENLICEASRARGSAVSSSAQRVREFDQKSA